LLSHLLVSCQEIATIIKKVFYLIPKSFKKYLDISDYIGHCTIQMDSINKLSSNQSKIFEYIREYMDREGASPTYREIAGHFGYRSPKAAVDHVRALEKKGYLARRPGLSRGIGIPCEHRESEKRTISVPILGHIPAGYPDALTEYHEGTLDIDPEFLNGVTNHKLFVLRVKGESMTGRGIYDGDLVVVDRDKYPKERDIIVALIDGENTLNTLVKQGGRFHLKAENPDYPDLIPVEKMSTQGVVRAVLRRLKG
jgi:repressor LexA